MATYDQSLSLADNLQRFYNPGDGTPESGGTSLSALPYQKTAYPVMTAFQEGSSNLDYGGDKAFEIIQSLGPNATLEQVNAALVQQGLRPFSSTEELKARSLALPGHNSQSFTGLYGTPLELGVGAGLAYAGGGAAGLWGAPGAAAAGGVETGLAAELAAGAPELAGTMGLSEASLAGLPAVGPTAGGATSAPIPSPVGLGGAAAATGGLSSLTGMSPSTLSLLGLAGATGLGMYGANQQGDALRDIANQSRADRASFLGQSTEWLNNPDAYFSGPGKSSMDAVLRSLSVKGNPAGMPSSMTLAGELGSHGWLNAVTGLGNLGLSGEDTRANMMSQAAGADANALNALGYGIGQATNPPTSLEQLLRGMRGGSLSLV